MSHLRLRYVDPEPVDDSSPIPFPAQLAQTSPARRSFDADIAEGRMNIAHSIERSLDDVQRRLDEVKNQLDDAFHLPTPDEWPPSAA